MHYTKVHCEQRVEVKKSTFISSLIPIDLFNETLLDLKQKHPKASHIVWAYRKLNEFDQIVENSSDDGEPKGCAGAPTLSVLRGESLINTALLTVRYFGGTKLGTGGMVRAYSSAAKAVIQSANLHPYEKRYNISFETPYRQVNRYEHYFNGVNIPYPNREFKVDSIYWSLFLTQEEIDAFKAFEKRL
ncbi:MAG: YigZ family protein [Epsilonproteobacteria bacterium]|nr:YigZ family protein [Campylobacterota bacterium]